MGAWRMEWKGGVLLLVLFLAGGLALARNRPSASAPCPFPAGTGAPALPPATQLAHCGAGFADAAAGELRRLHGGWLLATDTGLLALAADGTVLGNLAPGRACRAVATLPPGQGRVPPEAPRLAYWAAAGPAGEEGGLFAVGTDGTTVQVAAEELEGKGAVTGLALDRHGTLFAACAGSRDLLRLDRDGGASHQATLPDPPEPGAGLLALALDPATGDLIVDDGWRLRRVTATGAVAGDLAETGGSRSHLAVHGRLLVWLDANSGALRGLHLDQGGRTALLEGALGTRLNGPLAINPEGRCLLARQDGWVTWNLPQVLPTSAGATGKPVVRADQQAERPATPAPDHPRPMAQGSRRPTTPGRRPSTTPRLTARQAALDHFRAQQLAARAHKQRQRQARRRQADRSAVGEAAVRPPAARRRWAGLACLALLAGPARGAPLRPPVAPLLPVQPVEGFPWGRFPYPDLAARMDRMETRVTTQLEPLGPICDAPELSGRNLRPCLPGYRAGLLAQLQQVHRQMARLFVDPKSLGAGACRPGLSKEQAEAQIELDQGDRLAEFDRLAADAATLWYLLARDGYALQTAATPLVLPEILGPILGQVATSLASLPSFTTGEVGHSLLALGDVLEAIGATYGKVSNRAFLLRARYQRWANRQVPALLACATGSGPVPAPLALAPPAPVAAPFPAMAETLQWLQEGCAVAAGVGLAPAVCAPETFEDLRQSNSSLAGPYLGLACSSAGAQLGVQAPCRPDFPISSLDRSNALTDLEEFGAEVAEVGYDLYILSEYLEAGVQGLTAAGNAALRVNATGAAVGLYTAANTLAASASGLFAATYELFRLGSVCRSWQALVNQRFNAEDRAKLDQAAATGSSTGPDSGSSSTGAAGPVPATGLEPGLVPEPQDPPQPGAMPALPSPAGARETMPEPVSSKASRVRPATLRELLAPFWGRGAGPAPDRDL